MNAVDSVVPLTLKSLLKKARRIIMSTSRVRRHEPFLEARTCNKKVPIPSTDQTGATQPPAIGR